MRVTITMVEHHDLAERWRDQADRSERVVASMLREVAGEHVRAAQQLAGPGPYRRSFRARQVAPLATEAGSVSPLASILEDGRKPGRRPPPQSIQKRAGGSLEAAGRAADRIAARGTVGLHTVRRANTRIRRDGTIERSARNALRTILEG